MNKGNKELDEAATGENRVCRGTSRLQCIENWPELAERANWAVGSLAKLCGVSVSGLQRHFREAMGKPPKAWLLEHRQKRAIELLQHDTLVKEVAMTLGYQHGQSFTRQFKKSVGYPPSMPRSSI